MRQHRITWRRTFTTATITESISRTTTIITTWTHIIMHLKKIIPITITTMIVLRMVTSQEVVGTTIILTTVNKRPCVYPCK